MNIASILMMMNRLEPNVVGQFSYGQVWIGLALSLCSFGATTPITVQASQRKSGDGVAAVLQCAAAVSAISSCFLLFGFFVKTGQPPELLAPLILAAGSQIFQLNLSAYLVGIGCPKEGSAGIFAASAVFFVLILCGFAVSSRTVVELFALSQLVGALVTGMSALRVTLGLVGAPGIVHSLRLDVLRQCGRSILSFGSKSAVIAALTWGSQWLIQTGLILKTGDAQQNAIYALGSQVYNILIFIPSIVGPLVLARISTNSDDPATTFAVVKRLTWISGLCSLMIFVLACSSIWLVIGFLPPFYRSSYWVLVFSAAAALPMFVKAPISIFYQSRLEVLPDFLGGVTGTLVTVVAIYLGVISDALGASAIRVASSVVQCGLVVGMYLVRLSVNRRQ